MQHKLENSINILQNTITEINANLQQTQSILSSKITDALINNKQSVNKSIEPSFFDYANNQTTEILEKENIHLKQEIVKYKKLLLELHQEIDDLIKQVSN